MSQQTAATSNNQFAAALYAELGKHSGNVFFSPLSVFAALALTHEGAGGATAQEIEQVLHISPGANEGVPELTRRLTTKGLFDRPTRNDGLELHVANALWLANDYQFRKDFLARGKDAYGAEIAALDFSKAAEASRKTINGWVEQQTSGKIVNLIQRGLAGAKLVLTDAIYMKAKWEEPFKAEQTGNSSFYLSADKKIDVPTMFANRRMNYFDGTSFQAVELPYKGERLSAVIFLPKDKNGLASLEKTATAANLSAWMASLKPSRLPVLLRLPKFKITQSHSLAPILESLGIRQAFKPEAANFSGMTEQERGLYISDVIHKAYVEVDEEGTEAAAATAVVMEAGAAYHKEPDPILFIADHPFLFLICDNDSGSILFLGRLANPSAE